MVPFTISAVLFISLLISSRIYRNDSVVFYVLDHDGNSKMLPAETLLLVFHTGIFTDIFEWQVDPNYMYDM